MLPGSPLRDVLDPSVAAEPALVFDSVGIHPHRKWFFDLDPSSSYPARLRQLNLLGGNLLVSQDPFARPHVALRARMVVPSHGTITRDCVPFNLPP